MKVQQLKIADALLIEQEPYIDQRGEYCRHFCKNQMKELGLEFTIVQSNLTRNYKKGVMRGMHYQKAPFEERKIIACFKGAIYDVIADIRPDSPSYMQWEAVELTEEDNKVLYIPAGVAHGFQTLKDDTIAFYSVDEFYHPEACAGFRWNDPKFNIQWPDCEHRILTEKDTNFPLL